MKFFIPDIEDPNEAEEFYQDLKSNLEEHDRRISDQRIYSIRLWEGTERKSITVGYQYYRNEEKVLSIFYDEIRKIFYVITPHYGVNFDNPMMVGNEKYIIELELFQNP